MLRSACCVLLVVSLTGCALANPFLRTDYVEVPVPTTCVTWTPERAPSVFAAQKGDEPVWAQVRSLLIDRANDQQFIEGQAAVIHGCE
jgi:hypothetical protein